MHPFRTADFVSPHPEESTAYIVLLMERMAEIARELDRSQDAEEFSRCAGAAREGYQALVRTQKHSLDTDRQAKLVRPLFMKLLDEEQTGYARKRLLQALENQELPGWLCMPKLGATTIWENWEGTESDAPASLNHYSKGAVIQWVFDTMCGIRLGGENEFIIAPRPGGHFTSAKAEYASVYGKVSCGWKRSSEGLEFEVAIPANCRALVRLPDGSEQEQAAGERQYFIAQ